MKNFREYKVVTFLNVFNDITQVVCGSDHGSFKDKQRAYRQDNLSIS